MKDNDIIKALKCCILKENCAEKSCELCPYEINYECRETMFQDAINLIKHQKFEIEILKEKNNCSAHFLIKSESLIKHLEAEVERTQKIQDDIDNFARELCKERILKGKAIADFEDLQEYIKKENSEAIREFAERLKKRFLVIPLIVVQEIDNLVKEMTED